MRVMVMRVMRVIRVIRVNRLISALLHRYAVLVY